MENAIYAPTNPDLPTFYVKTQRFEGDALWLQLVTRRLMIGQHSDLRRWRSKRFAQNKVFSMCESKKVYLEWG